MIDQIAGEPAEKHIPVLEKTDNNQVKVTVGAVAHPMLEEHWIQWIELYKNGQLVDHTDLAPGQMPEAIFTVVFDSVDQLMAKEKCNLHGIWQSDKGEVEE